MNTIPGPSESKSELRKQLRRKRARLDAAQRRRCDAEINRHLLEFANDIGPKTVAAYCAFDGEPDLAPALGSLDRRGVRLALPVVRSDSARPELQFRQWWSGCAMTTNRFGIAEPDGTPVLPLDEIDLALIPLVAWDASGGRLGMGAGFYDRLLQPSAGRSRLLRVGVGYREQQVERVPLEPWDVVLHCMLTEDGCIECGPRKSERPA